MSYSTYVGPYLRVKNLGERTFKEMVRTCLNKECSRHGSCLNSNFCPECGSEVDLEAIITKGEVDIQDLLEEVGIGEDFFNVVELGDKKGLFLLYNKLPYYCDEDEGEVEREITEDLIRKEVYKFSSKKKIDRFMGHLEENDVWFEIRYGAVGFEE